MIKLVNVSKYYSSNDAIALGLRKINLEFHVNEFVAVVGESGSGKTTLLNVISGIDSYEEGEMFINGKETSYFSVEDMENYRKKYVAFVFQNYNLIDSYTVLQNVEAPLILSGYPKEKIKKRALEIIRRVGLEDHIHHKATRLSGGQKQRVVIARALAKDCPIIAADEPTGNLDSESAKEIIKLLHEISKDKLVIVVTHDFNQVKEHATRKIRIYDGEIVEDRIISKVDKADLPEIADKDYKIKFKEFLKFAFRNLLAVPKKSLLMLVVFTFFSIFVAFAYGGYTVSMNESTSSANSFFSNTNPDRIVVKKVDNSKFTTEDFGKIEAFKSKYNTIVNFDYVLDASGQENFSSNASYVLSSYQLAYIPIELIENSDLAYGTMPVSSDQIVIALNDKDLQDAADNLLGKSISMTRYGYIGAGSATNTYTVSGLVDKAKLNTNSNKYYTAYVILTDAGMEEIRKDLYINFTSDASFTGSYDNGTKTILVNESYKYAGNIYLDVSLGSNQIVESINRSNGICGTLDSCVAQGDISITDSYHQTDITGVSLTYTSAFTSFGDIYVSQDVYDKIFYNDIYQVSVMAKSDLDARSLLASISNIKDTSGQVIFDTLYPYDSAATSDYEAIVLIMMNIGLIGLIVVVLIGSTLITYVIFRSIINTKLHDYAIFRTIGANKKIIKYFIYLENFYIVIVAYIIFLVGTLFLPNSITINSGFLYMLKVFNFQRYLIFFILELIMAFIISSRYCNRIFSESVNRTLKTNLG